MAEPKLAIILQPLLRAQRSTGPAEQAANAKQPSGDGPVEPIQKAKRRAAQVRAQEEANQALDNTRAETARAKGRAAAGQASGGKGAGGAGKAPSMPT